MCVCVCGNYIRIHIHRDRKKTRRTRRKQIRKDTKDKDTCSLIQKQTETIFSLQKKTNQQEKSFSFQKREREKKANTQNKEMNERARERENKLAKTLHRKNVFLSSIFGIGLKEEKKERKYVCKQKESSSLLHLLSMSFLPILIACNTNVLEMTLYWLSLEIWYDVMFLI